MGHQVATVRFIYRYPVKSMAGESVERCRLTEDGLEGDRLLAFESSGAPSGMLRMTGKERQAMLGYQPTLLADGGIEVRTPSGEVFLANSMELLKYLETHSPAGSRFSLTRAEKPQTDVRPLSLISLQTIAQISDEAGVVIDARRFRANLHLDCAAGPFGEDELVGRTLSIGEARILIRERDPRCRLITYDPEAPMADPMFSLMKVLDREHQGRAGVYASILQAGAIEIGDAVRLIE